MAKQNNSVLTHNLSGAIGNVLVFRQTAAGTLVEEGFAQPDDAGVEKQKGGLNSTGQF